MLVPIYLPTGTTTRKRFIFANIYNDTLVILTTATFVYVCIYIYIHTYVFPEKNILHTGRKNFNLRNGYNFDVKTECMEIHF